MLLDRKLVTQFDWGLFCVTLLIPFCGLIVLYSAGYDGELSYAPISWLPIKISSVVFIRQLTVIGAGLIAMVLCLAVPGSTIFRYAYFIYGLCLVLLLAVLVFGYVSHGSQRWISFVGVRFQPSELMKLGLILALARYMVKNPPKGLVYSFKELVIPALIIFLPVALVMKQPDLGTALCIATIGIAMLLFAGIQVKTLLWTCCSAVCALVPIWQWLLKPYQKRRVLALLNPDADPLGSGYHIIQSKIAVGSGSMFGKGFLKGTQTQLEFLPEHTTDFIFSVLAEEWGFMGSIFVLTLYFLLLYRMLRIAGKSKDLFSSFLTFGVCVLVFFHIVVNIGMVVGIMPVVGLPLPLFSYGGTSMVLTLLCIGLVLGVSMRRLIFSAR